MKAVALYPLVALHLIRGSVCGGKRGEIKCGGGKERALEGRRFRGKDFVLGDGWPKIGSSAAQSPSVMAERSSPRGEMGVSQRSIARGRWRTRRGHDRPRRLGWMQTGGLGKAPGTANTAYSLLSPPPSPNMFILRYGKALARRNGARDRVEVQQPIGIRLGKRLERSRVV